MRHALTVVIAVCCLCVLSFSQTADELIAKNIQARGGIEKMKAIKTLRMVGKFDGGGRVYRGRDAGERAARSDPRDVHAAGNDCGAGL